MTKKSISLGILFSILATGLIFILGLDRKEYTSYPVDLYQVYLNGDVVGILDNEEDLYNLIDKEQEELKTEYNVDKIYPPVGLEIMPIVTYNGEKNDAKSIYEKIKHLENFTLKGYEITIKNEEENKKAYILNEEDLKTAIDNTIVAFLEEESLEQYRNNTQPTIVDTGVTIENVYIKEEITIKEAYISTNEQIFTNANDLSRYLLFGTTETQETYLVLAGDTIKTVAEDHGLNISELLIANPDILNENVLLFPGQELNIGLIDPLVSVVVERTSVQRQVVPHETDVKYDNKIVVGTSYVEQVGVDGESKTTYRIESVNGQDTSAVRISAQEITPAINEIVVKGGLSQSYIGDTNYWAWPTIKPYVITSLVGWRWGSYHNGIDIAGTGYNSPIYSIQAGEVVSKGYNSSMGNFIYIDHKNGYWSVYMHLASIVNGIEKGAFVTKGQYIGGMGSTGFSTGTHLHLSVWKGYPYGSDSNIIDPLTLYPESYR